MFSAGLSSVSIDWTQYDGLDPTRDNFGTSNFDQAQSFAGFDPTGSTEPTLTSNSGDVSESEEFVPAFGDPQLDGFRGSTASSYLGMSQSQPSMLTAGELGALEFDQFKGTAAASKFLATPASFDDAGSAFPSLDDDTYWNINSFDDGIAQSPDPVASGLWMDSV